MNQRLQLGLRFVALASIAVCFACQGAAEPAVEQAVGAPSDNTVADLVPKNGGRMVTEGLMFAGQPTAAELEALAQAGVYLRETEDDGIRVVRDGGFRSIAGLQCDEILMPYDD